jgi:hypothetical protein
MAVTQPTRRIAGAVLALPLTLLAAPLEPAPQEFRQEVVAQLADPSGGSERGFQRVLLASDGSVRASDGRNWFAVGDGRLEAATAPQENEVTQWRDELRDRSVRQWAGQEDGEVLAATDQGLWERGGSGSWRRLVALDDTGRDWLAGEVRGVAVTRAGLWWVALPGAVASHHDGRWRFWTGSDGLPVGDLTCVAVGPEDEVWFGSRRGAVRFDGRDWAYRQGPRWLPGDEVRSIAVGPDGTAWFATDGGVSSIGRRRMTLAEKAAFYEEEIERYIKRTPFGYTSEVGLGAPGDRSQIHYSDSDNDGLWTAMYGAGECFAYAATKRPEFKRRAQLAFEALRFLQQVTQGGPHSPPKGYVARTIRPVEWPDPNIGRLEADRAQQQHERLWKVYEPRWPRSADGQWYWKSDTSSDELDGHYFLYAAYFDHAAETDAERERVREVVRDLTDHLVAHDFCLVDHDGKPTRWAVFGPKYLNHDPDWWVERGLNSLSILSYLAVTEHITGEAKYGQAARDLIEKHGYGANVMNPKVQMGVGSGNQSDDEMASMCFYNLLRYTRDEVWREKWRFAFYAHWALEQPELNPFFHFAYAAHGLGQTYSNAYGSTPVAPWPGWQEDALVTLRGFPLDRVNWPHRNSHRLDLIPLRSQQSPDLASEGRAGRGYRVNGRVLPVEERHFGHWNTDPWRLDYGGDGRELASGTVFLLPYYLGLYHGFIAKLESLNRE